MVRRKAIAVILAAGAASLSLEAAALAADAVQETPAPEPEAKAFSYGGHIVDELGNPISGAEVTAIHYAADGRSLSYIDVVKSDATGMFTIYRAEATSGELPADLGTGMVSLNFNHADFECLKVENLQRVSREKATNLTVTLRKGRSVQGTIVDASNNPVAGALVEITFRDDYEQRRGVLSDANGLFAFHGLLNNEGVINVLASRRNQAAATAHVAIRGTAVDAGTIALTPVRLPSGTRVHELFGMKLVDVNDSLKTAFHLPRADGVLILDPGVKDLGLDLQCGDQFWIVGDKPVKNFEALTRQMLAFSKSPGEQLAPPGTARVVYAFSRPGFRGNNTQFLPLSAADISELSALTKVL